MPLLSNELRSTLGKAASQYHQGVASALGYLEGRGISPAAVDSYRLGVVPTAGDLEVKDHECKAEHCVKYLGLAGRNNLYNVSALFSAGDTIAVCEGEMDSLVLTMS